jgi:hypothetical protein
MEEVVVQQAQRAPAARVVMVVQAACTKII